MVSVSTLLTLLLILSLGLIIPELFKKSRIPFITLIILAGAITGPYGLNYIQADETIGFFGFLGMAILMFMAGLETDITKIYSSKNKILLMSFLNSFIPFLFGLSIVRIFGYSWQVSILVGIIFISSSIAVITSFLRDNKSVSKDVSQLMLSSIMVTDIISLIALGLIFQSTSKITPLSLPVYIIILILSIILLFKFIPIITRKIVRKNFFQEYGHERRLRFIIVILIAVITYFSFLGAHPILASFLAGLSLSGVVIYEKSEILKYKLNTIAYGVFIPVFFFVVGMDINLSLLRNFDITNVLMISLIFALIFSKIVSGYIAGRMIKLSKKDSYLFGSMSITQLTTTLAVVYAASSMGILDSVLVTSVVILAVITTIVGPVLSNYISNRD